MAHSNLRISGRFLFPAWLILVPLATSQEVNQTANTIRIVADWDHVGNFSGVAREKLDPVSDFLITAPLPSTPVLGELLPSSEKEPNPIIERLGFMRIEAPPGDVSIIAAGAEPGSIVLFEKTAAGWESMKPDGKAGSWKLKSEQDVNIDLGVGMVLPRATTDLKSPEWPNRFFLEVRVPGKPVAPVRVPVRVTPFIIPSPLDPVEQLLVVAMDETTEGVQDIKQFAANAKVNLYLHQAIQPCDQWMQDTIETGVFVRSSRVQSRAALVGLRGEMAPRCAGLDKQIARWLVQAKTVMIEAGIPRKDTGWIDWYGNLETTPRHQNRLGKEFPYGRILVGKQHDLEMHPGVLDFLESQQVQWPPIVVDTSWLVIGHVDEIVNFVPAKSAAGFKVLLPSPAAARQVLEDLVAEGKQHEKLFAGTRSEVTIEKLLSSIAASQENRDIDRTVAQIRVQLAEEMNLADADFVMLPTLFEQGGAVIPSPVNSVVVNGHLLVPAPHGPIVGGADRFEVSIRQLLAECEVQVHFIDSWNSWHRMGGEVHCGTNVFRRLATPQWWNSPAVDPKKN
jgi:hypothetical protein